MVDAVIHCNGLQANDHKALHLFTIGRATKTSCQVVTLLYKYWRMRERKWRANVLHPANRGRGAASVGAKTKTVAVCLLFHYTLFLEIENGLSNHKQVKWHIMYRPAQPRAKLPPRQWSND